MMKIIIYFCAYLFLSGVLGAEGLEKELDSYACSFGPLIGKETSEKANCKGNSVNIKTNKTVRPKSQSKVDKLVNELLRSWFPSMRVRRMNYESSEPENNHEEEELMPGIEVFKKDHCLAAISYDLHYLEKDEQPKTLFMPLCRGFVCHEFGIDRLQRYIIDHNVNHMNDPAAFFGCIGNGIDI